MSASENRAPDQGGRIRRAVEWRLRPRGDPLGYLVALVALVVYALHGFDGRLTRDLAVYGYAGQQVADGVPPYEGILNRSGPLAHLVPAIGVAIARGGGFDEVLGMRLVFLAISVACAWLVYVLARTLFESRLAGLAAAATFLAFAGFIEYASNGPREKTLMVLLLLCTLLTAVERRWFAAGLSLGLATLVWQPVFLVGIAAIVVALVGLGQGQRLRALTRVAIGVLIPASICLVYFASFGALGDFVDAFLMVNFEYTEASPFWSRPRGKWGGLEDGYGWSSWVILAGLGALTALAFLALRSERRKEPARISVVAVGLAGLVGVAWTLRDFNGWPDAFLVLPFAAVGIGGIAVVVGDRRPRGTALLAAAWIAVAVVMAVTYATTERRHGLDRQRDQVAALLEQLPSDTSILSVEAPQPLVLSGMTNPTRHQMFVDGLDRYVDDTWPGGLVGFADWVGRQDATVIAIGRHGVPTWLRPTIRAEYRRVGRAIGWTWYVDRSVDPRVLASMSVRTQRE
jgi:Dolichyl-phosphate-mannose-protein mannosyltransferase